MDGPRKLERRRRSKEAAMKQAEAARKKASTRNSLKELNSSVLLSRRTPHFAPPNPIIAAADISAQVSTYQSSQKVVSKSNLGNSKQQLALRTNSKASTPDLVQRSKKKKNHKPKEKCDFGNTTPDKSLSLEFADNVSFPAEVGGGEKKVASTPEPATPPPIEASLSPEVPIGAPLIAATSACFAAGHVIARLHDRRKCRPRGILTVGRDEADGPKVHHNTNAARASLTPPITEASMHWVSSPSEIIDSGVGSSLEPSSRSRTADYPADACVNWLESPAEDRDRVPKDEFFCTHNAAMREEDFVDDELWSFSPSNSNTMSESPKLRGTSGLKYLGFETTPSSGISVQETPTTGGSTSPFSMILERVAKASKNKHVKPHQKLGDHSYGSELQSSTYSDNSSGDGNKTCTASLFSVKQGTLTPVKIDSILEVLGDVSLSTESGTSEISCQEILPDLVFNSEEFRHFLKHTLDEISSAEEKQQNLSEARISWREGLISGLFNSSELDFCKRLSDDKESLNDIQDIRLESNCKWMSKDFGSDELTCELQNSNRKFLPAAPLICAESISTEEFELFSSGDSDWALFYKNNLFEA